MEGYSTQQYNPWQNQQPPPQFGQRDPNNPQAVPSFQMTGFPEPIHQQAQQGIGAGGYSPQGGNVQLDAILGDPDALMMRAMREMGLNPAASTIPIQSMLRHATDAYTKSVLPLLHSGQAGAGGGDMMAMALGALKNVIGEGLRGGKVFGGVAPSVIQSLMARAEAANAGGENVSMSDQLLATLFNDPSKATNLVSSMLFGGMPGRTAAALSRPLALLEDTAMQGYETGRLGPNDSPLRVLRELYGGMYGGFR